MGSLREDRGTVDAPIGRHPVERKKMSINYNNGREAVTHYKVLRRFRQYTHVECRLETGRTHQIRVHMASIHHPLLGDAVYGPARCPIPGLQGQTLHAGVLGIRHPRTGAYMEFTAPLPDYFAKLLRTLPCIYGKYANSWPLLYVLWKYICNNLIFLLISLYFSETLRYNMNIDGRHRMHYRMVIAERGMCNERKSDYYNRQTKWKRR